ncbi:MAG: hypothetical protein GX410_11120 [Elusimicrobia bacterium]|nr:hypothetical protein [Elusimicrobiota bacterium]
MTGTRMWKTARLLRSFTLEDLAVVGTVTRREAAAFLKCLLRRDMLRKEGIERRPHRGRPVARFCFKMEQPVALPAELEARHD